VVEDGTEPGDGLAGVAARVGCVGGGGALRFKGGGETGRIDDEGPGAVDAGCVGVDAGSEESDILCVEARLAAGGEATRRYVQGDDGRKGWMKLVEMSQEMRG